jgi:hypothetical protein
MDEISEAESAANRARINWRLLQDLYVKPHPNLKVMEPPYYEPGIGEVLQEAVAAHHLLDLVGIPQGRYDDRDIDARVWLAVELIGQLRDRLARIESWHSQETGPGGMVGSFCVECGQGHPCSTRRMAQGVYRDPEGE